MFIELEPIFNNEGSVKALDYTFTIPDCDIAEEAHVVGEIRNRAGIVSINATANYVLDTICDRCASVIHKEMCVPIEHVLVTHLNDEDNDDFILVEDTQFNLDELVREDILLSLPTKILCRPDCKGLCQYCGANLNEGSCSCKKPVDPRLAALTQLLEDETL